MIISHSSWSDAIIWEALAAHLMDVPFCVVQHSDFYRRLILPKSAYTTLANEAVYRFIDKLICLSRYAELYFRTQGIDAHYLPNQAAIADGRGCEYDQRKNKIVFVGRLHDPVKRVEHALYVLRELLKLMPDAHLVFVGDFVSRARRTRFYEQIHNMGLEQNVTIAGWVENVGIYMDEAAAILITSYTEAFPLSLAEAQARGLPCVTYELPIMQARNNESVIQVPQGDYRAAARELSLLLQNPVRWRELSGVAMRKAREFEPEFVATEWMRFLDGFHRQSRLSYPDPEDYKVIMRTLAFYACVPCPQ